MDTYKNDERQIQSPEIIFLNSVEYFIRDKIRNEYIRRKLKDMPLLNKLEI